MSAPDVLDRTARVLDAAGHATRRDGDVLVVPDALDPTQTRWRFTAGLEPPPPGAAPLRRGSSAIDAVLDAAGPALRRTAVALPARGTMPDTADHGLRAAPGCALRTVRFREGTSVRWAVLYRREVRGPHREDALVSVHAHGDEPPRLEPGPDAVLRLLELARAPGAQTLPAFPALASGALDAADALARTDAETFARACETASLAALAAELRALGAHYAALAGESSSEPERAQWSLEWSVRRDELLAARALRVRTRPLALVAVHVPERTFDLELIRGEASAPVRLEARMNLATRALEPPACAACNGPARTVSLCTAGTHAVCDACARRCAGCDVAFCAACGAHACALGDEVSCARCRGRCDRCGREACGAHRTRCATCRGEACAACSTACAGCNTVQCAAHLKPCARCEAPRCGACLLACAGCGARACRDDRAECVACGRVHCRACLSPCLHCGRTLCAADATRPHGCGA